VIYQGSWYIGKVICYYKLDETVYISFLNNSKQFFKWPLKPDVFRVDCTDVLCSYIKKTLQSPENGTEVKNKKFDDYLKSLEILVVTIIEVAYIKQIRYVYYCY
jgi:hypothetical protein